MADKLCVDRKQQGMTSQSRLTWRQRLALVLFGLVIAVFLTEITARALHLLPVAPPDTYDELRRVLGLMPPPYQYFFYSQPGNEFRTWVQYNYRSLRDIDHEYEVPFGTQRIMFLGDSYTAGWQVPLDQTYVSRLRTSLNSIPGRPTPYDLINAGLHGWGTDQQYLYYRHEGYRYNSDLVVLQIYAGNDVVDNGIAALELPIDAFRPYFLLDDTGTLEYRPYQGSLPEPFRPQGLVNQIRWFLDQNSFTYRLLTDLVKNLVSGHNSTPPDSHPTLPDTLPVDYELFAPEYDSRWQTAWEITRQLIHALREEVESHGAQMVVVLVPPRQEENLDSWTEIVETYHLANDWESARPTELWIELFEEEEIPFLDMRLSRQAYMDNTGHLLSFARDGHWTSEGHCVAAIAIQNWLFTENLVTAPEDNVPQDPINICG